MFLRDIAWAKAYIEANKDVINLTSQQMALMLEALRIVSGAPLAPR